jgi:hypothetical protein
MVRIAPGCDIPNLSDIVEDGFDTVFGMFNDTVDYDDVETDVDLNDYVLDATGVSDIVDDTA